ncbi:MAG: DUF5131 family protein, partial [Rhodospirillales bacterium]|nr:DUF5131 family protein [Rhodospirillales bacterium]
VGGGAGGRGALLISDPAATEIYTQCLRYQTAFFFKQWGTWGKDNKRRSKSANGREYRGRTWDDMPTTQSAM